MLQKLLPKNVAHKVVEKTDEFFRKKFADKTVKPNLSQIKMYEMLKK